MKNHGAERPNDLSKAIQLPASRHRTPIQICLQNQCSYQCLSMLPAIQLLFLAPACINLTLLMMLVECYYHMKRKDIRHKEVKSLYQSPISDPGTEGRFKPKFSEQKNLTVNSALHLVSSCWMDARMGKWMRIWVQE